MAQIQFSSIKRNKDWTSKTLATPYVQYHFIFVLPPPPPLPLKVDVVGVSHLILTSSQKKCMETDVD